jgi:hypothetical protein
MEEVVTEHRGGALDEKQREQVGAQSVQNFSGMNESRDSRSNIRTVLFRSTPCRTKSRPKMHNRRTSPLRPCHSASPYLQNHIRLCRTMSYPIWIPVLTTQVAAQEI